VNIGGDEEIGCSVRHSVCQCTRWLVIISTSYTTGRNGGALLWKLL